MSGELELCYPPEASEHARLELSSAFWRSASGRDATEVIRLLGAVDWALRTFALEDVRTVLTCELPKKPSPEELTAACQAAERAGFLRRREAVAAEPEKLKSGEIPADGLPLVLTLPRDVTAVIETIASRLSAIRSDGGKTTEADVVRACIGAGLGILAQRQRDLGGVLPAHEAVLALARFDELRREPLAGWNPEGGSGEPAGSHPAADGGAEEDGGQK